MKYINQVISILVLILCSNPLFGKGQDVSLETGYTITKVRTAQFNENNYVIASSYEGTILAVDYDGNILWKNPLSGFMTQDMWCADITADGNDEILIANADGNVYCLDAKGEQQWAFKSSLTPMYSVCVVHKDNAPYVVCGGFDMSVYYLSPEGKMVKELKSSSYSKARTWGGGILPPKKLHISNFLRPMKQADGSEILLIHGTNNLMQDKGYVYQFEVLADLPFIATPVKAKSVIGNFRTVSATGEMPAHFLLGTSGHNKDMSALRMFASDGESVSFDIHKLGTGYSVTQCEIIPDGDQYQYLFLAGSKIFLLPMDMDKKKAEVLTCAYAFNDMWKDNEDRIILASAQSGGSCIHILDTKDKKWKSAYEAINPQGKIDEILKNTASTWAQLEDFHKPVWEREPVPVYLMTEKFDTPKSSAVATDIMKNYESPIMLNGAYTRNVEQWDRSEIPNEKYKNKRDRRKKYTLTQEESVDLIHSWYDGYPGVAYWGGHGNDPYMWHVSTTEKVLDKANGKKTVLIYPEMVDHSADFDFVMNDLVYPLAEYSQTRNANLYIRTKHAFWQSDIYTPVWSRLLSGEFADVFVPSMEETTDKSMELSLVGRLGLWTSGAVNSWGSRSVMDNPSFDRSRQFCNQQVPNHFLRHSIYSLANGAQYINNFAVNPEYMCLLWDLIAKGALYVPKVNEVLSYSPVHLSIVNPDKHYMEEASNVKWCTFYNEEREKQHSFVFSRLNGSWPGAPVTDWDFSKYAAGVDERRSNFLPPYENGQVLITPPQNGDFADKDAPRGALKDHLHPLYKGILKEYYTNGRVYCSADGKQVYKADEYYKTIEADIKASSSKLPIKVSGEVAWVVAQTSPKHLRLTIIDGGYLNPDDRDALVVFQTIKPVKITDVLSGETLKVKEGKMTVNVPCGLFRFIDVELSEAL